MSRKLKISHPAVGEFAITLSSNGIVVGRHGGSVDIELNWDKLVSRSHGRFWLQNNEVWYVDLDSQNGSWLGEERLKDASRVMPNGLSLLVGDTYLTVVEAEGAVDTGDMQDGGDPFSTGEYQDPKKRSSARSNIQTTHEDSSEDINGPATIDLGRFKNQTAEIAAATKRHSDQARRNFVRSHPRYVISGNLEIAVSAQGRSQNLPLEDISVGGAFLQTNMPPDLGSIVTLHLPREENKNHSVKAQVVRAARTDTGAKGVGVEFLDLTATNILEIKKCLRWITGSFTEDLGQIQRKQTLENNQIVSIFKHFFDQMQSNNLYAALDVSHSATKETIQQAVVSLRETFTIDAETLSPPQAFRITAALAQLDRIARLFTSPDRRLIYDFRNGHERIEERYQEAIDGTGEPLATLRTIWKQAFTEQCRTADLLAQKAFAARHKQEYVEALIAGRQALELDPFYEDLKNAVAAWARML